MYNSLWWTVPIPAPVITSKGLAPVTRFLYMIFAHHQESQTEQAADMHYVPVQKLQEATGIRTMRSLRKHLQKLTFFGWISEIQQVVMDPPSILLPKLQEARPLIEIPASLISHPDISPGAKILYAVIAAHCQPSAKGWTVPQPDLAEATGVGRSSVRALTRELTEAAWLEVTRAGQGGIRTYKLLDPHLAERHAELRRTMARLEQANYSGEAIMREMLNLLIDDDEYVDNVRLGALAGPPAGTASVEEAEGRGELEGWEEMESSRWYPKSNVAFKFEDPGI